MGKKYLTNIRKCGIKQADTAFQERPASFHILRGGETKDQKSGNHDLVERVSNRHGGSLSFEL